LGIYNCTQCGQLLIDPDLYYRAEGEVPRRRGTWQTRIKCPSCGKVQTMAELRDHTIAQGGPKW